MQEKKYLISVSGLYPNALLRQVQAELSEFVTNAIPPAPTNISFLYSSLWLFREPWERWRRSPMFIVIHIVNIRAMLKNRGMSVWPWLGRGPTSIFN
jgi:hypothetical protein